jgi:hypothetical protein
MHRSLSLAYLLGSILLMASIVPTGTTAQQAAPAPKAVPQAAAEPKKAEAPTEAAAAAQLAAPARVSTELVLHLIRSTLSTLNDANRSGNYSVLRDLAAPEFQAKNTAADLALAFADMRRRKLDMYAVGLVSPQLTTAPEFDSMGKLRLVGRFPTRPLQIAFDILFEASAGQWRLLGMNVSVPEAPSLEAQGGQDKPQGKAASKPEVKPVPKQHPKQPVTAAADGLTGEPASR